jgi:hypothetical protein
MKLCKTCNTNKELSDFYSKNGKTQSYCKECQKVRHRKYYEAHKDKYKNKADKHKLKIREYIQKTKDVPCKDCGVKYPPWVMQFDHLRDKSFDISRTSSAGINKIMAEIDKCEVVCANCHADRTYKRSH